MLTQGPRPLNNSISSQVSPHPHEVARVLNTITEIRAASAKIIRRDERGNSRLSTATLYRVSALSESLWEEVMSLPLSTILPLHKPLTICELILVDIQHILSSSDPVEILDDTINRRLDDFLLQFREALDLLSKGPAGQRSSPNSTHFFQNSHHLVISGGNFSASISHPVVHDPVVREQSRKILQIIYIQCFFFSPRATGSALLCNQHERALRRQRNPAPVQTFLIHDKMDPHSKLSQFNHRVTKAGPQARNIESIPPPKDSFKMPSRKPSISTKAVIRRPLATNSRVKQDEIFKRDMYLSFVTNALQQKTNGLSDSFDELVGQFSTFSSNPNSSYTPNTQLPQVDAAQIRLWIVALSHVVSRLERTHASLVHAIVNMPWTVLDNATVKSYTIFIGMLLSARPEYLSFVLAMIAQGFTYQSGLQALDTSLPESSRAPVTHRLIYDRLHDLLRHILSLIPTLPSSLQVSLIRHFPHKRQNQVAQTTYIRNLLKVSSYCTELADKILATIIDRAIQIDVEIQIELEELEEDGNVEDHDIFELDPFDVVVGQEGDLLSDDEDSDEDDGDNFSDLSSDFEDMDGHVHVEVPTNVKHIHDMVNKLDAILTLLFEHFKRTYESVSASNSSRPLSPLELLPLPPLSSSTPSLSNPHTASFGSSSIPLTATPPAVVSISIPPQSQQATSAPVPHTEQYLRIQFQALLSIFDRIILRTFKSRYTQFLIFWYTSLDPEFADIFQGMLVDRALLGGGVDSHHYGGSTTPEDGDKSATVNAYMVTPELTRAAAASYIGGFVSRATFVDREGARRVVGLLCEFLNAHLESVEQALRAGWATSGVDGALMTQGQHTIFYAVTQAVFLIFCFRWRDLVDDDMGDDDDQLKLYLDSNGMIAGRTRKPISTNKGKWMPELGILKRVVVSVLNPLKVCSTNVVMQFARVAHATDFIYCYTILETNKRAEHTSITSPSRHRQSDVSTMTTRINNPKVNLSVNLELNAFFPFDPYRLRKSSAFILGVYREWSSVAIEDEDEDDDDEEEELDRDEDGTSSRYLSIPRDKENDGGLGESLGAMSISQ